MKVGIVVDSACDLRELGEWGSSEYDFTVVPLKLEVGEKEFVDDAGLDVAAFMEEVAAYTGKSGSAAPSPGEWMEAFEKNDITYAFTITKNLSGSYNSSVVGKEMTLEKYPDKKIYILNTYSTGPEMSLMVRKTTECIKAGKSFEETVQTLEEYIKTTKLFFILEHMDNLVHNGRVSKLSGSLAGLLGIRIFGQASDIGTLEVLQKKRGKMTVYNVCVEEMIARGFKGGRVIIAHCLNPEKAEYIKTQLLEKYPQSDILIMPAGGLDTFYAEKDGMLIGFETESR
ncbi:MAG: DegV family protein [Lachnospiraceae bacterium]|nr:DegV family protein [Lachnospiraceae bacterium]